MKCIGCCREMAERLEQTPRGPVYYDVCDNCGGMWFDVGEMDAMVLQVFDSVESSSRNKAMGILEPIRKCPRCKDRWLDKVFFLAYSEVLLDYCRTCRGFWLDGGELELINQNLKELKEHNKIAGPIGVLIRMLIEFLPAL